MDISLTIDHFLKAEARAHRPSNVEPGSHWILLLLMAAVYKGRMGALELEHVLVKHLKHDSCCATSCLRNGQT